MLAEEPAHREELEVTSSAAVVPQVRRWVRDRLHEWGHEGLADEAELAVSELVGNVVLHAPGPARIVLADEAGRGGVQLLVTDSSPVLPVRRAATEGGTTGRGLNLLNAVSNAWGVDARDDGLPGKVVWCRFGGQPAPDDEEFDADALLAAFDDVLGEPTREPDFVVTVGDAPTELVAAAKDHLDGLLREFVLAESAQADALPHELTEDIRRAVARFAEARAQVRRLLAEAFERGAPRVTLRFVLPAGSADAGEDFLRALAEADSLAQDRRLLSLESPVEYRVLREWYVGGLVAGLRDAAAGRSPAHPPSFEHRLLVELRALDARNREIALAAQLQRVTSRLAGAQSLIEVAEAAVTEGVVALGASGGSLLRPGGGMTVAVLEWGGDLGLSSTYGTDPARPVGPSTRAMRSQRPVFVEGRDEDDDLFPHLQRMQPKAVSVAALPLLVVGEVVGALRFSFDTAHVFSTSERAYLTGLSAQTAQAVARIAALDRAHDAEEVSTALAGLGEQLAASRSLRAVLDAVAQVLVPRRARAVAVHVLDERGALWCPLVRHSAEAGGPADGVRVADAALAARVIAGGATERLAGPDEIVDGVAVPLVSRGGTVGALTLLAPAGASMRGAEISLAEDVGRRAGVALDNVRTFLTSVRLELALTAATVGSFEIRLPDLLVTWDERVHTVLDIEPDPGERTLQAFLGRVIDEDRERTAEAFTQAVRQVSELAVDFRIRRRDDSLRWIDARGRALPGADGDTERLVGIVVDVTEERDASRRALTSLEQMTDGFLQLDPEWRIDYVNPAAERITGVGRDSLVGRPLWEAFAGLRGTVFEERYRGAVASGEPATFEAYFAPLGTDFEVRAYPGPEGLAIYFADMGERRATERARDGALRRLQLLNEAGSALTETLEVEVGLTRLAELMIPEIADLVTVDLRGDDDPRSDAGLVVVSGSSEQVERMRRAEGVVARRHNPRSAVHRVLAGEPFVEVEVHPDYVAGVSTDAEQRSDYLALDIRQAVVVPLVARSRIFGAMSLFRTGPDAERFTAEDVEFARELGRRAGINVDNAVQYTTQRSLAEALQRSLLAPLPRSPQLRFGAAYEPSSAAATVGGDWYDAFDLLDGSFGLVIGDVMGHDIFAAAAMGQLRSVLRACAADGDEPAAVLDHVDRLVTRFGIGDLATVIYARIAPSRDGSSLLQWAAAGHPPPLLLQRDRPARYLSAAQGRMLGVELGAPRLQAELRLEPGSTVLLYTDGLVEQRGDDIDDSLEALRVLAESLVRDEGTDPLEPERLCAQLLRAARREGLADDVAALAVSLPG